MNEIDKFKVRLNKNENTDFSVSIKDWFETSMS